MEPQTSQDGNTEEETSGLRKVFPQTGWNPSYWQVSQLAQMSFTALGLHTYLMSLPDGWDVSCERIAKERVEGRDTVRSALRELTKFGLAKTIKARAKDGTVRTRTEIHALPTQNINQQVTPETAFQGPVKDAGHTGDWISGAGETGARQTRALRTHTREHIQEEKVGGVDLPSSDQPLLPSSDTPAQENEPPQPEPRKEEDIPEEIKTFVTGLPWYGDLPPAIQLRQVAQAVMPFFEAGSDLVKLRKALVANTAKGVQQIVGLYIHRLTKQISFEDVTPGPSSSLHGPSKGLESSVQSSNQAKSSLWCGDRDERIPRCDGPATRRAINDDGFIVRPPRPCPICA